MKKSALGLCLVAAGAILVTQATSAIAQYQPTANGYRPYAQTGFYTPPKSSPAQPMPRENMIPSPSDVGDDIEVIPTQPANPVGPMSPSHSLMPEASITPAPYPGSAPSYHGSADMSYGGPVGTGCENGACATDDIWGNCGAPAMGAPCGPTWFGGVGGLFMTRDDENEVWLSFDTADPASSVLGSRDASMDWTGGVQADIGYCLGCGWGISASYWGIYPSDQSATWWDTDVVGALNTTFDFTTLNYDDGVNPVTDVNGWYDGAAAHQVSRRYEFHNVELNLINGGCCMPYDPCCLYGLRCSFLMGVRFFKFYEDFTYATSETDYVFNYGLDDIYYNVEADNSLIGFQIGGTTEWFIHDCFTLYGGCKMGVYGNNIEQTTWIGGANGGAFVGAGPNAGTFYDIHSSKQDVALLGEMDFGMSYRYNCHWSFKFGYRAVGVTGVALSTNQIPANFADIEGARAIDSNGSLILHGGYGAIEFCY